MRLSLLFMMVILLPTTDAQAKTYTVISYQPANPPYNIRENNRYRRAKTSGIIADLFIEISRMTGDEFELMQMPVARAHREFEEGNIDIEPHISSKWRQHSKVPGIYSVAYDKTEEVLVYSGPTKHLAGNPESLLGERIGVVRGFVYPTLEPYFESGKMIKESNISQDILVAQLVKGRLKQVILGKATIEYMIKTEPELKHLSVGGVIMSEPVKMRLHPNKAELMPRLNKALMTMMANGTIKRINAKYR